MSAGGIGLTPEDFGAFFEAVWGYAPFPWQQRLLSQLADASGTGDWPQVLALPTGVGKTAAIDIAVFHLAMEAVGKPERRPPLRIAYVVDRRLIVDDGFARADSLCETLRWPLLSEAQAEALERHAPECSAALRRVRAQPVMHEVARRLSELAGGRAPLRARALRGGAPREDDWARTPTQPTVLCSTVDQVGSRLMFRGYGVSERMRPVHAGLLGSDCLILLDEAHLSEPFRQTLTQIQRFRAPDKAPFGFAMLSATPGATSKEPFALNDADYANEILRRRLNAKKPAELIELAGRQGMTADALRIEAAAEHASKMLKALQAQMQAPAIGVVVNRVARARAVFDRLRGELGDTADLLLLIGPQRAVDRDAHVAKLKPIRTGAAVRADMQKPLIIVATQTIEAGVDLDFDGLVTEAAPLDALRQRMGRLNRSGERAHPLAVVLAHKEDIGAKANDPVYGDRIAKTWGALKPLADASADNRLDFGSEALKAALANVNEQDLATEPGKAPVLMPAYVDLWAQTFAPTPLAKTQAPSGEAPEKPARFSPIEPDVALFLHGAEREPANVQIVWRADLEDAGFDTPSEASTQLLTELLGLTPPRAAEAVEIPISAARAWLRKSRTKIDFSDAVERAPEDVDFHTNRLAFRFAGADSARTGFVQAGDLRPGDLIIVPAAYGGCDEWGWSADETREAADVADAAAEPYAKRRFAVRLSRGLIREKLRRAFFAAGESLSKKEIGGRLEEIELQADRILSELTNALAAEVAAKRLLEAALDVAGAPQFLRGRLWLLQNCAKAPEKGGEPRIEAPFRYGVGDQNPPGIVFLARRGLDLAKLRAKAQACPDQDLVARLLDADPAQDDAQDDAAPPATESDDLGNYGEKPVTLAAHAEHMAGWARIFCATAVLAPDLAADVELAARLHDIGKADARFQNYLAGGDPYGPDADEALAKSGRRLPREAWERAGLPPRWRHEAASVRRALDDPSFAEAADPALVLWLIGVHHGFGRPFFPHADPAAQSPGPRGRQCLTGVRIHAHADPAAQSPGPQSLAFRFDGRDWAQIFADLRGRYGAWGLARLEAILRLADHRASDVGAPPSDQPAAPAREALPQARVARAETQGASCRLEGLEPDNLLAFLALLGLLRALEKARPQWRPRIAWDVDAPPLRPRLFLDAAPGEDAICEAAADGAKELAEAYVFPVAADSDKPQADLNYSAKDARKILEAALADPRRREQAELWAALMSDAAEKDEKIEATPLCVLFGQGHQHFLDRLAATPRLEAPPPRGRGRTAKTLSAAQTLREALFAPWTRQDPTFSFRWDPAEDVRYALRADDPSGTKSTTQHGANRLAALGLAALAVAPARRGARVRLEVVGGRSDKTGFAFSWPVWREPASLAAIRALLAHPGLAQGRQALAHLGVVEIRRARRHSVGKFMNFTRGEAETGRGDI